MFNYLIIERYNYENGKEELEFKANSDVQDYVSAFNKLYGKTMMLGDERLERVFSYFSFQNIAYVRIDPYGFRLTNIDASNDLTVQWESLISISVSDTSLLTPSEHQLYTTLLNTWQKELYKTMIKTNLDFSDPIISYMQKFKAMVTSKPKHDVS